MDVGESFCSACGGPSIWATHDERVAWEVEQWRIVNGPKRQEVHTPILSVRAFRDAQRQDVMPAEEEPPQTVGVLEREPEPVRAEVVAQAPEPVPPMRQEVLTRWPEHAKPAVVPEPVHPTPILRAVPEPQIPLSGDDPDPLAQVLALLRQISDRLTAIEGQLSVRTRSRWARFRSSLARIFEYPES